MSSGGVHSTKVFFDPGRSYGNLQVYEASRFKIYYGVIQQAGVATAN